jgi:DeoR family transcriptional regulator, fructose operon transcriptional repressor
MKRSMVSPAREVYTLVDHTKWARVASASFCRTNQLDGVFSDVGAPAEMVATLREMGIEIVLSDGPVPLDDGAASPVEGAE